jgi:hypothetical protein
MHLSYSQESSAQRAMALNNCESGAKDLAFPQRNMAWTARLFIRATLSKGWW